MEKKYLYEKLIGMFKFGALFIVLFIFSCKSEINEKKEKLNVGETKKVDSKSTYNVINDSESSFESKKASTLNDEALVFVKKGDYKEAKKLFYKSLSIEPKSAPVYNNLGLIAYNEQNVQLASDFYNKAIMIDSTYYTSFINFSSMLLENDYFTKSIELNNYLIKNCPDLQLIGISHFFNAYAYLRINKCEISKNHLKTASYFMVQALHNIDFQSLNKAYTHETSN